LRRRKEQGRSVYPPWKEEGKKKNYASLSDAVVMETKGRRTSCLLPKERGARLAPVLFVVEERGEGGEKGKKDLALFRTHSEKGIKKEGVKDIDCIIFLDQKRGRREEQGAVDEGGRKEKEKKKTAYFLIHHIQKKTGEIDYHPYQS